MGQTLNAIDALKQLQEGNRRFVSGEGLRDLRAEHQRRLELVEAQQPVAIVLGCSDSRVPAELVFNQGLGDLFVIRVAGNIVSRSPLGSVEYAVERTGVRLVVVLGHSCCGAVIAALEELQRPAGAASPALGFIVGNILPAVAPLVRQQPLPERDVLVKEAVRANISASAHHLRHGSDLLERLVRDDGLLIVGAEYSLETGQVDFFDGMP